jgi:hypothetical protein
LATKRKQPQGQTGHEDTPNPAPVIVTDLKTAKRLFSRVLRDVQAGEMDDRTARTLIYGLSEYVRAFRDVDFDTRLTEIEQKLGLGGQGRAAEALELVSV